ncbi:hypothetical protein Barb6_03100 [Bacteroidales bacterium Barb6]|nr:hypothetical protein Barb6_03100 [Bacteroidales bacterium Barb6]
MFLIAAIFLALALMATIIMVNNDIDPFIYNSYVIPMS